MSLRQVLTVFNIERQLNDDETALLNALRGWTDAEREMFINALSDKPQKKSSKKGAGKGGGGVKSVRGESLKGQLSNRRQAPRLPLLCIYVSEDGDDPTQCGETENSGIHDSTMGYSNYHPFVPPASTATNPSSANGEATDSTASSATEKGAAGSAVQGASGGD